MSEILQRLFSETWPAKAARSAFEALMLPGQIAGGELATQPSQPGMWSDEDEARSQLTQRGIGNRAVDLAGLLMGGTFGSAPSGAIGAGPVYRRSQRPDTPDNGVGYMMFAKDPDSINGYGKNLWEMNPDNLPAGSVIDASSPEFRRSAYRVFRGDVDRTTARSLVEELDPERIVTSAGVWDSPELVSALWDRLLDRKGWHTITTRDGAVTFDPAIPRRID